MTRAVEPRVIDGLGGDIAPPRPLPVLQLDRRTYDRALDCVHCGLCLPACPTYTQNGLEADSPRGRIALMKNLADGRLDATDSVLRHLDLCLDCRACETACPSGVVYHELIEETRDRLAPMRKRRLSDKLLKAFIFHIFPYPMRLKLAMLPARLLQRLGLWGPLMRSRLAGVLPEQFRKMQQMLPAGGAVWETRLGSFYPAKALDGVKRATVGLFSGCVGSVLFQHVNRQTIELLQHFGCDVHVPRAQVCCGAIHHHAGGIDRSHGEARRNMTAFGDDVDYIVNNAAGCGAMLKEYPHLLRDDPDWLTRAEAFSGKVRDISELLVELGPPQPPRHALTGTAAYHDACHLAHAQKVLEPPRRMLGWIEGLRVVPLPESDMCCGAAGTYNLTEPEMARQLAERKIRHIQRTGATVCVTGNVGCAMQIQSEADRLGVPLRVVHPVTLLHEAVFGRV